MIKNYFTIALRNFWRHKLFTFINIVGLSIGISAALVIYLIVHFDFTFDKFHPGADRIYRVVTDFTFAGEPSYSGGVTGPLPDAVNNEVAGLAASAPFYLQNNYKVVIPAKTPVKFKRENNIIYADERYFNLFPYKWLVGSPKNSLNGPYQVVLTSAQAKKYFPALAYNQVMGKQVIYDDSIKTTVTGVIEEFNQNSDLTFHDFISFATIKKVGDIRSELQVWGNTSSSSQFFVKLAPKTTPLKIEAQLAQLLKKHVPQKITDKGTYQTFRLQPLNDIHFNNRYDNYENPPVNKNTLYGLMAIAVFLLLLGCINFVNLTTAQAPQRAKEIGIRKTMGSTRPQLIVQRLGETFLITLLAVIIAMGFTPVILKLFADFISPGIKADLLRQPDVLLFLTALAIIVTFLAGFYPALVLSGYKPVMVLKNQAYAGTGKTRTAWLRKSLTVAQFTIAQFFIMATILVSKQIYFALNTDLGFKKDAIVYIHLPWTDHDPAHKEVFANAVRQLPQVEMVSLGSNPPSSSGSATTTVTYNDGKNDQTTNVQMKSGDENYINVYKIKLLAGRNVRPADSSRSVLVNNTYAHILQFKNPNEVIGKYLRLGNTKKQIAGIVGDFYQASLHAPVKPLIITFQKQAGTLHIALRPQTAGGNEWKTAIASVQKSWKQIYPDNDFEYDFFDESIAKFYDSEQHTITLLKWATGLSIFISCLGLLGLAIYTTNQRTKEIGIRKVLGATVTQIAALLSTEVLWLILLAFVVVTPAAWWAMHKWLESFANRTTISWWIFAASGAGMLLTAMVTSGFQTLKAALANPVKSLRSE